MSRVNKKSVQDLRPNTYFDDSAWLDEKFLLLPKGIPVTEVLIKTLLRWGFKEIATKGSMFEVDSSTMLISEDTSTSQLHEEENEELRLARKYYMELTQYIQNTYENFGAQKELNLGDITEKAKEAIDMTKEHKPYIMRLIGENAEKNSDYYENTAKITIISILIAEVLRLPQFGIVNTGVAGLLHKIGLTRIPAFITEKIYNSSSRLPDRERKLFSSHPAIGMKVLNDYFKQRKIIIDPEILIGIGQHNEKENGTGFPHGTVGKKISQIGKILAVANGFNAKLINRSNRDGFDRHSAMIMMLREMGVLYDERVVKALLSVFSLYPPGTYVLLDDESIGIVATVNDKNIKAPIVELLLDKDLIAVRQPTIVNTMDGNSPSINRAITMEQVKSLKIDKGSL